MLVAQSNQRAQRAQLGPRAVRVGPSDWRAAVWGRHTGGKERPRAVKKLADEVQEITSDYRNGCFWV